VRIMRAEEDELSQHPYGGRRIVSKKKRKNDKGL